MSNLVVINDGQYEYYMDSHLAEQLEKEAGELQNDDDRVYVITGKERCGKSVLAMQLARRVDPSFDLSRLCMDPEEFERVVRSAKKGQAVIFDEAYRGYSAQGHMSKINRKLVELMMEMGQRNLFVFIVLPNVWMLQWYVAVHRAKGMFLVYRSKGKRGFWCYYNDSKKNFIYNLPRDKRDQLPKSKFRGRFLNQYVVPEDEYRKKKAKSFSEPDDSPSIDKPTIQRNILFNILHERLKCKLEDIASMCAACGWKIDRSAIGKAIKQYRLSKSEMQEELPEVPEFRMPD